MDSRLLRLLKESNDYISGSELGERLQVSRSAVWKEIKKLKEEGYVIDAVTNKGYLLKKEPDILRAENITEELDTVFMGQNVYCVKETTSTNDEVRRLALAGAPEGTLVTAESQNAGKGRLGRRWESPKGDGIWMSVLLKPDILPTKASKLTLIAGLSVCRAVRKVTGLPADIKWPNDVLIHGKKFVGILTEMNAEMEKVNFIIVGIGINVNIENMPREIENAATSLQIEGGRRYDRVSIIKEVMSEFERCYLSYVSDNSFVSFLEEYEALCITLGRDVNVLGRNPFSGKAVSVNKDGELIVEREDGTRETVFSGEVSIRMKE